MADEALIDILEHDNKVKLEKYYNGRRLRHYLQLLEIAETIIRSPTADEKAKAAARGFSEHYRRMIVCIVMKPFNPDENDDWKAQENVFMYEVSRLNELLSRKF